MLCCRALPPISLCFVPHSSPLRIAWVGYSSPRPLAQSERHARFAGACRLFRAHPASPWGKVAGGGLEAVASSASGGEAPAFSLGGGMPCSGSQATLPHCVFSAGSVRGGRTGDTPCRPSGVLGPRAVAALVFVRICSCAPHEPSSGRARCLRRMTAALRLSERPRHGAPMRTCRLTIQGVVPRGPPVASSLSPPCPPSGFASA